MNPRDKDSCCWECRYKINCVSDPKDCIIAKEKRNYQYFRQREKSFVVHTEPTTKKGKGH